MLIKIDSIKINERLRAVDELKVREIAESIQKIGMLNPITLSKDNELIAGMHRLRACQLLGLIEIEAKVVELDEQERELAEIDENLIRYDLHYTDRGEHLRRRKKIYEEKYPETRQGGDRKSEKIKLRNPQLDTFSFAEDTAAKTNVSTRVIYEEIQIAERLTPEVRQMVKELGIPKTEALKLSRLEPEKQKEALAKLKEVVWISIGELGVDVANIRGGEWDYNMEFVHDIKENGIINPLVVRSANPGTGKKYAIVNGSRRYNAAIEAGIRKVPCFIIEMDDVTAMGRSIAENKHRKDIPAWRYVFQVATLRDLIEREGKSSSKEDIIREISSMTGMKRTTVQRYMAAAELPPKVIELMKPRGAGGKFLSVHVAANIATKLKECTYARLEEVAEHVVGLNDDTANEVIDQVKVHPDMSVRDIRKIMKGEPLTGRYTVDLDADAQNALEEACVQEHRAYPQVINRALKSYLENTEGAQEKPAISATPAPEASSAPPTAEVSALSQAGTELEHPEPAQPTHQPSLSPEVRTYLETSGLSQEKTEKLLSNPLWLAHPDDEKKRVIDSNVQVEKKLAENAARMKKLEEEQEANWKRTKEEERNDPNRNPKTADPDVIFFCEDCITPFRIKHSDRESCPACHSTNIQYSDFAMSCGGGNCWRPRPLKDSLTICPCGCGFGYDDEGKWYSPAQYEGVMV